MTDQPGALPRSEFGRKSTADQVTAGMDLSGKTMLITGCTSGIGYEAMKTLAKRGAHVLGVGRTQAKAEQAWRSVSESGIKGNVTPLGCEQEDFASVAALADTVRSINMPIDALILNAGIIGRQKCETVKGLEKQFVVNHLSHFILINRLMEQVKAAPQGRFVIVASESHHSPNKGGIDFDDLSGAKGYSALKFYGQSKLANVLTSRELAKKLAGTNTTVNALHPGFVYTNIFHNLPGFLSAPLTVLAKPFMKTSAQGAATTCYVATSPALTKVSGAYFDNCNPAEMSSFATNDALAERLWKVSEELTQDYLK